MPLIEGFPEAKNNITRFGVGLREDIHLTPQRHTYLFVGSKDEIINRLVDSGDFFVRSKNLTKFDMTGQGEWDKLDADWGFTDHFAAPRSPSAAMAGHGASAPAAAAGAHAAAPTARDGGFSKGIFIGVFTTHQTVQGSYIPTSTTTVGFAQAKSIMSAGALQVLDVVGHAGAVVEAVKQAHDAHNMHEKLHHIHGMHEEAHNTRLLRHMPRHVDHKPAPSGFAHFVHTVKAKVLLVKDKPVIVRLSLLPDRNMVMLNQDGQVRLQVVANYLDAMDAVKA